MNKDIIYIDVEDDITAIIGKVKDAKEKIVALVPPKRIGVLQSAVNLRLLARAATQADKRLVLITNNAALTALASAAKLPVAKNLQSKPEIAAIPALDVDDGNDIIDGAQLPVGDLQRTADVGAVALSDPVVDEVIRENTPATAAPLRAAPPAPGAAPARPRTKKGGPKVPNFNTFRKKLVLIIVAAVVLLGALIWAIFFAPRATITISARTNDTSMNKQVVIGEKVDTSASASTIKAVSQTVKKDVAEEFNATEKKEVGEKATGVVRLSKQSQGGTNVPAGTVLVSSSGLEYRTETAASIPASTQGGSCFPTACAGSTTVTVIASEGGAKYNGASGNLDAPNGVSARFTDATTGGTDKIATVVSQEDVQRATDALKDKSTDDIKKELKDQFGSTAIVIDASFTSKMEVASAPAVGAEAPGGKAKLTGSITYTIVGVAKDELNTFLKEYFTAQLDDEATQRIYDNGAEGVTFTNVSESNGAFAANLSATAKIGPKIEDKQVQDIAKGKRYGDIQSSLEAVQGVNNVDIEFWPFWVSKAPNDTNRIKVEFKLDESL